MLDDPAVGALVVNVHDLTERKAAQRAVVRSEARYRNLIEAAPEAVLVHAGGRFVFANPAGAALLGLARPEDLVGRLVLDFVHPSQHSEVQRRRRRLATGETLGPLDTIWVRPDGTEVHAEITVTSADFEGRHATQLLGRDTTELFAPGPSGPLAKSGSARSCRTRLIRSPCSTTSCAWSIPARL